LYSGEKGELDVMAESSGPAKKKVKLGRGVRLLWGSWPFGITYGRLWIGKKSIKGHLADS